MSVQLGLNEPLLGAVRPFLKGIVVGAPLQDRPEQRVLPAAVPRLLVPQPAAGLAAAGQRHPGDAVAGRRRGDASGWSAAWRSGWSRRCAGARIFDRFSMGIALAGVSLPIFFTGLIVAGAVQLQVADLPERRSTSRSPQNPLLWAQNLVLPWITLAFLYAALYARLTRAGMLETMGEDYIRTARAKGLPERTVVVKHGLRAALTPIVTIFGLDLGLLLGGAVLTETRSPCTASACSRSRPSGTRTCPRSWAWSCWLRSSS